MDQEQAADLGAYLKQRREAKGLSTREVAAQAGVDMAQVVRLEQGRVPSPRAETLAGIADCLDLPLADVFGLAGYAAPRQLPSFRPYLRAKYQDLPADAIAELEKSFRRVARKYGTTGPVNGEDET